MYTPNNVPTDPALIPDFLSRELLALASNDTQQRPHLFLQTLNAAPTKPREGMVVKADGTNWNPGAGAGVYVYISSAWARWDQQVCATPNDYGSASTGNNVVDDSAALTAALALRYNIVARAGSTYRFKDVTFSDSRSFDAGSSRVTVHTGATNLFKLNGYNAEVKNFYVSDAANLSGAAVRFDTGRGQRVSNVFIVNCGAGAIKMLPASGSVAVSFIDKLYAEDITGIGLDMGSSVNELQATNVFLSGHLDFVATLGKPRAGTIGWKQNTPVVGGLAVGGHLATGVTVINFQEGYHLTAAQLSKFDNCIADGCTSYGLIVDGASVYIDFTDLFVGTSLGIKAADTAKVNIDGLRTILNGTVPPWGQAGFFDIAAPYYDVTVKDTAQVVINGDAWRGDKRASVDSTATLTVTGGQWIHGRSETTVAVGTVTYLSPSGQKATEVDATVRAERDGWLFLAQPYATVAPGAAQTFTYVVRIAGAAALTVTVTGAGVFGGLGYGQSIAVLKGQEISVQLTTSAGAGVARHECAVQLLGV